MTAKERIFQAILFEIIWIILSTLLTAFVLQHNMGEMGILMFILSLLALFWNMIFNYLFDQKFTAPRETRSLKIRILHAVLFEGGFLLVSLPLIMWWLKMGLWQAMVLDFALTVFVLIYTVVFHWFYDNIRVKFLQAA